MRRDNFDGASLMLSETGHVQIPGAQAAVLLQLGMGLEDSMGTELAEELGASLMALDIPPQPQQQQQQDSGAGPALPQQQQRPPPPTPRPAATLQRLLAQLVVVCTEDGSEAWQCVLAGQTQA